MLRFSIFVLPTVLHIVTPTDRIRPPHIYGKIALHTKLLLTKLLQIAYEQLQIAFYLNTLYILIALKNEVAHLPALFYFQKIKYNNRIKCVCIRASTFFKWFGKLFKAHRNHNSNIDNRLDDLTTMYYAICLDIDDAYIGYIDWLIPTISAYLRDHHEPYTTIRQMGCIVPYPYHAHWWYARCCNLEDSSLMPLSGNLR